MASHTNNWSFCCVAALALFVCAGDCEGADETRATSMHLGMLYPNGVDVVGYTIEDKLNDNLYRYYTFGFPALASIGVSYYKNHAGNGLTASMGTGVGFLNQVNGSVAYQWQVQQSKEPAFIKLGVGYAASLVFNGVIPVLSYEQRFH
ncbi:MAG: hypothetical protein Q8O64_06870 [Sideroxyarcus sp.]|nr:hypothetical protein [Sideroxyarcus sp.]